MKCGCPEVVPPVSRRGAAASNAPPSRHAALFVSTLTAKVLAMFTRAYSLPKGSFFLFGPRATGKTTWLRSELPSALWIDLLRMQEVLAHMAIAGTGGEINYWGTPSGGEIDFIWRRGKRAVGVEVKASNRYRSDESKALKAFLEQKLLGSAYVVYEGSDVLKDGAVTVLPVVEFMRRLARGEVIPA